MPSASSETVSRARPDASIGAARSSASRPEGAVPSLSSRARGAPSSAIRDLLEHAARPGMISLAGGLPDPSLFPGDELASIADACLRRDPTAMLQYGETRGAESARAVFARRLNEEHAGSQVIDADEVVITTGSQQALDLLARVLIDPGDAVLVGDPDYLGALHAWRSQGADVHAVPVDAHGLCVDAVEDLLAHGLRPKACYLVPHFHNPTGATTSVERRRRLDELAAHYGFVVIEDDPYRDLWFVESPDGVEDLSGLRVRLRSTSKTLAPGLRVGALHGPRWLTDAVVIAKQSVDLHTPALNQQVVAEALGAAWYPAHVERVRATYRRKATILVAALKNAFGSGVECVEPAGGMFVWARFPGIADTAALLSRALDEGVCFVPGPAFNPRDKRCQGIQRKGGSVKHSSPLNSQKPPPKGEAFPRGFQAPNVTRHGDCVRLSFATASEAELVDGVARLARATGSGP